MAEIRNGVKAVLSFPSIYNLLQAVMGGGRVRAELVRESVRPKPGMRILDIGCGPAGVLDRLPEDVVYVGYDPSREYIAHARKKYGGRGAFHHGFFRRADLAEHPPFDLVLALGVLHHMDDGQAAEMLELAKDSLSGDGRLVTLDSVFVPGQSRVARKLIEMDRGRNTRSSDEYLALARAAFPFVSGTVKHRAFPPYTHWIMESRLLEEPS
jgi:SAM-dependent methyltransferase